MTETTNTDLPSTVHFQLLAAYKVTMKISTKVSDIHVQGNRWTDIITTTQLLVFASVLSIASAAPSPATAAAAKPDGNIFVYNRLSCEDTGGKSRPFDLTEGNCTATDRFRSFRGTYHHSTQVT